MNKKLNELYTELTDSEIELLSESNVDLKTDIDADAKKRIAKKINSKTYLHLDENIKARKHKPISRPFRIALIAAIISAFFVISASAALKFVMPKDFFKRQEDIVFDNIYPIVDTENAGKDEIKTVNKTVKTNEYTVTFEAIAKGKQINTVYENPFSLIGKSPEEIRKAKHWEKIEDNKFYAIFTIKGKLLNSKNRGGIDLGYCITLKGYAPSMLFNAENYFPCVYEENNVLYFVCDITDAQIFADKELHIAVFSDIFPDGTIIRMDETGDSYFLDSYDGIKAMFELNLDKSLADPEKAEAYKKEHMFTTNTDYSKADEIIAKDKAFKESGIDLSAFIGEHEWRGSWPLSFGEVDMAEEYIALQNERTEDMNILTCRELEKIIEEKSDDSFYNSLENFDIIEDDAQIPVEWIPKNGCIAKLSDGSEVEYLGDEMYIHFEKDGDIKLVIVPCNNIVVEFDMTVNSVINIMLAFLEDSGIDGSYFTGYYIDGELTRPNLKKYLSKTGCTLEDVIRWGGIDVDTDEDAVYEILMEFVNHAGVVEVIK